VCNPLKGGEGGEKERQQPRDRESELGAQEM
jgi:hypothetical protein